MKSTVPAALIIAATALLAACGGGGGGTPPTGGGGGGGPTPTPVQTTPPPTTTTASGTVVSDPGATPLAGVLVQVDPWIAYPTPGATPTPIATATTDANGHFTVSAKNGTYLLVIGPDAVNTAPPGWSTPAPNTVDTPIPGASGWFATVHDKVTFKGGAQTLVAPTMLPEPLYTPAAVETSGNYRLAVLDPLFEAPCVLAFNQQRQSHSLSSAVVDEWLVENTRAIAFAGMQPANAGKTPNVFTTFGAQVGGGSNCANDLLPPNWSTYPLALQPALNSSQTLWFAGEYLQGNVSHSSYGDDGFPIDPRVYTDPGGYTWP